MDIGMNYLLQDPIIGSGRSMGDRPRDSEKLPS